MDKRVIDRLEAFVIAAQRVMGGRDALTALQDVASVRYQLEVQDRQREKTARDVLAASSNEDIGRAVRAALVEQYKRNGKAKADQVVGELPFAGPRWSPAQHEKLRQVLGADAYAKLFPTPTSSGDVGNAEPVDEKYAEIKYHEPTYEQLDNLIKYGRWDLTRSESCELRWLRGMWAELKGCHATGNLSALGEIVESHIEEEAMMVESAEGEHGVLKDKKQVPVGGVCAGVEATLGRCRNEIVRAAKAWEQETRSAERMGRLILAVRELRDVEKGDA